MDRFVLDGRYGDLLSFFGISMEAALKKAHLPTDTFKRRNPTMTEEQYFRFMDAVGFLVTDPQMPIQIATTNKIESFSPPIFAAWCSPNGKICIDRLARYKRLIGPMIFEVEDSEDICTVTLTTINGIDDLPQFLAESEFAFLAGIIRRASREQIDPFAVTMIHPPEAPDFSEFLHVQVTTGERNRISFRTEDLEKPFISYDETMWEYFEPELTRRLSELDVDDSWSARVRSVLTEMLPAGLCTIEDAADRLGLSKRTLQRNLTEEGTTFQKQLNSTREVLAKHYIANTQMTTNDIAFLLGYQEINSFLRAFCMWTGQSISEYRKQHQ